MLRKVKVVINEIIIHDISNWIELIIAISSAITEIPYGQIQA